MNATMSLDQKIHYPVMLKQILSIISPQHGGIFIDCTFGGGGYSEAILKYSNTKVYALDRDNIAKTHAKNLIKKFPKRFNFFQDKFSNLEQFVKLSLKPKAIIFDLGISSLQIADKKRGFSFHSKESLNMEMGINKYSAYDVINKLDKKILANIIKVFGEEKDGKLIANKIDYYRKKKEITSSEELSNIIKEAKKSYGNFKRNPSTKTFQAIRIFVNQELTELILGLIAATKLLESGGIIVVVSFHSLEDRIVKYFFNLYSNLKSNPSRYFPVTENKKILFKLINKKAQKPNKDEISNNVRSRSAKLRHVIRNDKSFFLPEDLKNKFNKYFELENIKL